MASHDIAIVGLGVTFPDSNTKETFLENILARRAQFREYPDCRLPLSQYYHPDRSTPDKTYCKYGSFISDFKFDYQEKMIPQQTFLSTDTVHFLALETADKALKDAKHNGHEIQMEKTMVIIGNTLTGENSRTENTLRLKWPYVERTFHEACKAHNLPEEFFTQFTPVFKDYYQSALASNVNTLPGAMSNTIAGRIAGEHGAKGGAFTVDAACASGLLAVSYSCDQLVKKTVDWVVAGGVDMSLDTFESIGFAKVGALTTSIDMKVYDSAGLGFLPGEGCGMVVLKRLSDVKQGEKIYAVLKGWGISSDGTRTITAPSIEGEAAAFMQACRMAGIAPNYSFIEGHGTGTSVGDAVEISAINKVLSSFDVATKSCGLSSLKSILGHMKAAAGIGALIKTALCLSTGIIPPTRGIINPHQLFEKQALTVYPVRNGQIWGKETMLAGCQAMGFGGVNVHTFLEAPKKENKVEITLSHDARSLMASWQDIEVFVFSSSSSGELLLQVKELLANTVKLSIAELTDLSHHLALENERHENPVLRASITAGTVEQLRNRLTVLQQILQEDDMPEDGTCMTHEGGSLLISHHTIQPPIPKIAFLFPGNGAHVMGSAFNLVHRVPELRALVLRADNYLKENGFRTIGDKLLKDLDHETKEQQDKWIQEFLHPEILQPSIILSELIYYTYLTEHLKVIPSIVVGHSLGELMAFYAAGAFDEKSLILLAALRGKSVAQVINPGCMMNLKCDTEAATHLCNLYCASSTDQKQAVTVANSNHPSQTIIAGSKLNILKFSKFVKTNSQVEYSILQSITHAFHSPLMSQAYDYFKNKFDEFISLAPGNENGVTIITGSGDTILAPTSIDIKEHFAAHLIEPVLFVNAVDTLRTTANFLVEVGPGKMLSGILSAHSPQLKCYPVEAKIGNSHSLCTLLARLHVSAHNTTSITESFCGRLVRPFVYPSKREFFMNPCERAISADLSKVVFNTKELMISNPTMESPLQEVEEPTVSVSPYIEVAPFEGTKEMPSKPDNISVKDVSKVVLETVSNMSKFAIDKIKMEHHVDHELHMDSDKVISLINTVQEKFGSPGLVNGRMFSYATLNEIAVSLQQALTTGVAELAEFGGAYWVRNFVETFEESAPIIVASPSLSQKKVLLLHINEDEDLAISICKQLEHHFSGVVNSSSLPSNAEQFGIIVVLLPSSSPFLGCNLMKHAEITLQSLVQAVSAIQQEGEVIFLEDSRILSPCDAMHACNSFAATLHLERPQLRVHVINLPYSLAPNRISSIIHTELQTEKMFSQVSYVENVRKEPVLKYSNGTEYPKRTIEFNSKDLAIVSGGAKGITAECALKFGIESGCKKFALLGRSPFAAETEQRFLEAGLQAVYYSCDVTDLEAVRFVTQKIQNEFNSHISIIIHGAGILNMKSMNDITVQSAIEEISPKVKGFQNLIEVLGTSPELRMVCTFTSITGVAGMPGNAVYAYANQTVERALSAHFANTKVQFLSIAYSVWDEVGMGVTTGATSGLSKFGIRPITVLEGAQRFVDLMCKDPGAQQVIVSARYDAEGMDTWQPKFGTPPQPQGQFVDKVVLFRDGLEIITEAILNLEKHKYLADHVWKGEIILPAVMGIESMHQAVQLLFGPKSSNYQTELTDLKFLNRIEIPHDGETIVHTWAVQLEHEGPDVYFSCGVDVVNGSKRATHQSGNIILKSKREEIYRNDIIARANSCIPLRIKPKWDVYNTGTLFHGPYFQKLGKILYAEPCTEGKPGELLLRMKLENNFTLNDPAVRDATFQAVQLGVLTHHSCLPSLVERIIIYEHKLNQEVIVHITIVAEPSKYICTVTIVDLDGKVIDLMEGISMVYTSHMLDPKRPLLPDILNPSPRDEKILQDALSKNAFIAGVVPPPIYVAPNAQGLGPDIKLRHTQQQEFISSLLPGYTLSWKLVQGTTEARKPFLMPEDKQISITHDSRVCLFSVGETTQGLDIVPIKPHLASQKSNQIRYGKLVSKMIAQNARCKNDEAYAIVRSIEEAIFKADGVSQDVDKIIIVERHGSGFLFRNDQGRHVLSFSVKLTLGPKCAISVVVASPTDKMEYSQPAINIGVPEYEDKLIQKRIPNVHDINRRQKYLKENKGPTLGDVIPSFPSNLYSAQYYSHVDAQNQPVIRITFPVNFHNVTGLSRTLSEYFFTECMGNGREISVWSQFHLFTLSKYALLTTSTELKIFGEAYMTDVIELSVWQGEFTGSTKSTSTINYDFLKIGRGGEMERIAIGKLGYTYAKEVTRGKFEMVSFDELEDNADSVFALMPPSEEYLHLPTKLEPAKELFKDLKRGEMIFCSPGAHSPSVTGKPFLYSHSFSTDLFSSNFVQNIYFSNYTKWGAQTRDYFFYSLLPSNYIHHTPETGEFILLESKNTHVSEAMPFDTVITRMYLMAIYEDGVDLYLEFHKQDLKTKQETFLCSSTQSLIWVTRLPSETIVRPLPPSPSPLPFEYRQALFAVSHLVK